MAITLPLKQKLAYELTLAAHSLKCYLDALATEETSTLEQDSAFQLFAVLYPIKSKPFPAYSIALIDFLFAANARSHYLACSPSALPGQQLNRTCHSNCERDFLA